MLKKLLKYDLKWCFKLLSIFYGLAIFFSIICRLIEGINNSLVILIIDKICSGIVIAMIANIIINTFMRNWVRFIYNIYKDESYLTHTLPVSKSQIFLSKVLSIIVTLLVSFAVIIGCLAIVCLNKDTWLILKQALESSAVIFNGSVFSLVFVIIITIFFQFLTIVMSGILGIIIGHKSNNHKILKSIVLGMTIYIFLSLLLLGLLYIIGLINPEFMSIFIHININSNTLKNMMLIIVGIYVIYNSLIYIVSNKLLNNGINVD